MACAPLTPQRTAPADTPTATEVVYSHVDIKLHPLRLQLDTALILALAAFFKVRPPGAARDRADGRSLDKSLGLSAIERAGAAAALFTGCTPVCCA